MTENYKIPDEIKALLTEDFYTSMWDELANVFNGATVGVDPYGFSNVEQFAGTCGWHDAFVKCAPKEAVDYFDKLDWYDGDLFDGEIGEELSKRFTRRTKADSIRFMNDEELAEFLCERGAYKEGCYSGECGGKDCKDCWLDWLREEAEK